MTNTNIHYGIVIYTHTNVLNVPRLNWEALYEWILTTGKLYVNPDRTFICGSMNNMMKYFRTALPANIENIIYVKDINKNTDS